MRDFEACHTRLQDCTPEQIVIQSQREIVSFGRRKGQNVSFPEKWIEVLAAGAEPVHHFEETIEPSNQYAYDHKTRTARLVWRPEDGRLPPAKSVPFNLFDNKSVAKWAQIQKWGLNEVELRYCWFIWALWGDYLDNTNYVLPEGLLLFVPDSLSAQEREDNHALFEETIAKHVFNSTVTEVNNGGCTTMLGIRFQNMHFRKEIETRAMKHEAILSSLIVAGELVDPEDPDAPQIYKTKVDSLNAAIGSSR